MAEELTQVELDAPINTANPEPRCACVLLLDTSSSMGGQPIDELNKGVRAFAEALREDPLARKRTEVLVIEVGGETARTRGSFNEVSAFEPTELVASGGTPLGDGILQALAQLKDRKQIYQETGVEFFRPWLILMTDGAPTDGKDVIDRAISEIRRWEERKHVAVFPVAVGEGADVAFLARTSGKREPLRLSQANLTQFFEWASANLAAVSSSGAHGASDEEAARREAAGEGVKLTPPVGWSSL